jgi:hypothetical protein
MTRTAPTSNEVFTRFIDAANKQYRDAGLSQYQMRVERNGTVSVPHSGFKRPNTSGSAAGDQARQGASPQKAPSAGAAPADPAKVKRSGAAPKVVDLQQGGADAFKIGWQAVAGAAKYGVWQDGVMIGTVTDPSFAANLAPGASGIIQIDGIRADGTHTALTRALRVTRTADGKITFDVPGATGPATTGSPATPAA